MKKIIRLTENDLHRIVKNTVNRVIKKNNLREGYGITEILDIMYEKGDYSKLYADPRLWKSDVWCTEKVPLMGEYDENGEQLYFEPEEANYLIEDYLESHDIEDISLMGGYNISGGSTGAEAASIIVSDLLGKNGEEISEQLAEWCYTDQF